MDQPQTVTIGGRAFAVSLLTLGALKSVRAELATLIAMTPVPGQLPSTEELDAMTAVVFAAAHQHDPELSFGDFAALVDALPYDVAIRDLGGAFRAVAFRSRLLVEGVAEGEAQSPALDSTSPGSTA